MNAKIISSILRDYGISWAINRSLYSIKLKLMDIIPTLESVFEKKVSYPDRINIFEFNIESIKQFIRQLPEMEKQELIMAASEACRGRILGFSSILLDYGFPINWNLNPQTQSVCDIKQKWYRIPDFDKERGDIKVIWEISRFSHFITLARAYLLTEDYIYYDAFSKQLSKWLKENPYPYGSNFKCGQECALRMINALIAYSIFYSLGLTTTNDTDNIKDLILRCYRKILSNFFYAYKCIKNNHTISELTGMIIGAWCCGETKRLSYAFYTLDKVIDEQFSDDGGYKQFSFNYQRLVLQDLEIVLSVEQKVNYKLSANSKRKILKSAKLMYQCQDGTGDMPNYGSNDGALVFPVTSCKYRDFRPVINSVYAMLTGKHVYDEGIYDEEWLWFGHSEKRFHRIDENQRISSSFDKAGLYTIRNNNLNAWLMVILNDYHSRPAHMDQLHIDLWIDGINVLCDGGTYSYASELGKKLIYNESHNTVLFSKKKQMDIYGPFMIYNWTKHGEVKRTKDTFCGKYVSRNGYQHKRIIKRTDMGFTMQDEIMGDKGCQFEILFHTPCKIVEQEKNYLKLCECDRSLCILKFNMPYELKSAKRSLYYLQDEKIYCIAVCGVLKDKVQTVQTEIMIKGVEENG